MFIFQNALTLALYFIFTIPLFALLQFFLCFKSRILACFPACALLAAWFFVLMMALGVFGTSGGGFIGNEHLLGAAIFAILFLPSTFGIVLGWLSHVIYRFVRAKRQRK